MLSGRIEPLLRAALAQLAEDAESARIAGYVDEDIGQRRMVRRGKEECHQIFADRLSNARNVASYNRTAKQHRFHDGCGESFGRRAEDEDIRCVQEVTDVIDGTAGRPAISRTALRPLDASRSTTSLHARRRVA